MKKAVIGFIIFAALVICGFCYYEFFSDFSYLATMKGHTTLMKNNSSQVTFYVKKGEALNFICDSSIKHGTLKLTLSDLNGKTIKSFRTNTNYHEHICLSKDNEYEISATYANFIGKFSIKCK
ncbi:hypothetical protein [Clostridium hydrogenum]|uniref:hypothetical protein n=1 Tax=Clostridium hydrogenum TaxID=2855764 RepID=UPI001F3ED1FE|nr:hypothetical protein [Clostridium hydrogenum]